MGNKIIFFSRKYDRKDCFKRKRSKYLVKIIKKKKSNLLL